MRFIFEEETGLHFSSKNLEVLLICEEHNIPYFKFGNSYYVPHEHAYTLIGICAKHHVLTIA